jgi:hypothetical protein
LLGQDDQSATAVKLGTNLADDEALVRSFSKHQNSKRRVLPGQFPFAAPFNVQIDLKGDP